MLYVKYWVVFPPHPFLGGKEGREREEKLW